MSCVVPVPDPLITRAVPAGDAMADFFWTSGEDGVLRVLSCEDCEYLIHPPSTPCPRCLSPRARPFPMSGLGNVHSFTVNVQPWVADQQPYAIVVVELVEQRGLRLTSNLVGTPVENIRIEQQVRVTFIQRNRLYYPVFEICNEP